MEEHFLWLILEQLQNLQDLLRFLGMTQKSSADTLQHIYCGMHVEPGPLAESTLLEEESSSTAPDQSSALASDLHNPDETHRAIVYVAISALLLALLIFGCLQLSADSASAE